MKDKKNEVKPFDLAESSLEGIQLIEAGAGTGKTYALTALFIRLLLEKGLTAGEILVVTYTVAATSELRGRIRRKVREALEAFSGVSSDDAFVNFLVQKHDRAKAVKVLENALRDFDLASIFTIHGFCQRMLREHAFESGVTFNSELLADDSELRREVLEDFWRTRFYPSDPDFFRYAQAKNCGLKQLWELLSKGTAQPQITIFPETGPVELPSLAPLKKMFKDLQAAWPEAKEEIFYTFSSEDLNKIKYRSPSKYIAGMDTYLSKGFIFPIFDDLAKFTPQKILEGTKKGRQCPEHSFFEKCGEFYRVAATIESAMERKILFLKREMFSYFRSEFARRKQVLNIQSFDDLLVRFNAALERERGNALAETVRGRYKAALVDEFQDTDPVQYSIFHRIFADGRRALFFIGDPKQAIYGFRGADLFTYLQASSDVEKRNTLLANRRSEPGLIEAVNAIFSRAAHPFLLKDIDFRKAISDPPKDLKTLSFAGVTEPPFHLWIITEGENPIPKGRAKGIIARAVAAEIARLIGRGRSGETLLGEKSLKEADIAVLVRKHSEARMIQRALREKGIISVLYSDSDLFASEEAIDLERVLRAVMKPASESAFRAALATDLIGFTVESLEALLASGPEKEDWHAIFSSWREIWEREGFLVMYRKLLIDGKVRERLVSYPDGERRLTNYLHLGEFLHREACKGKMGISALVDWLALRRSEEFRQASEERQLRLESDADAVKVITIHMSKGLEFPIVFCPFNWDGRMEKRDYLLYHEKKGSVETQPSALFPRIGIRNARAYGDTGRKHQAALRFAHKSQEPLLSGLGQYKGCLNLFCGLSYPSC